MSVERRFAAFSRTAMSPRTNEIPVAGFCISAFVILEKTGNPSEIIMGHLNTEADWNHTGAQDHERAERNSKGWMLPSSHLILEESPQEAGQRILREQLGIEDQQLTGPLVFSEAYSSNKVWDRAPNRHWDLEFLFQGKRDEINPHSVWRDLRFVDLRQTKEEEMARNHEDILAHIGKWETQR